MVAEESQVPQLAAADDPVEVPPANALLLELYMQNERLASAVR
jgi:hypothetical protein